MNKYNNVKTYHTVDLPNYMGQRSMSFSPSDITTVIDYIQEQENVVRQKESDLMISLSGGYNDHLRSLQRTLSILMFLKFIAIRELNEMNKKGEEY